MKKILYMAATAAAMAMAPAAQAVVVDPVDLLLVTNDAFSADFVVSPESFPILNVPAGVWNLSVSAGATGGAVTWKFTDVLVDGVSILSFLLPSGKYIEGFTTLSGAGHTLTFLGTGTGSFGGSVAITAVPEPATWAMMLAGVAAVGTAMRRRTTRTQVSFS